jgi:hypothetical protein
MEISGDWQGAAALHISPKTVGHHVAAIFAKLGAQNRTQAVAHALQDRAALQPELEAAGDWCVPSCALQ